MRNAYLGVLAYKQFLVTSVILAAVDLVVLYIVVVLRKRKEIFIILTPLLMFFGSIANAIGCYLILQGNRDIDDLPEYDEATSIIFMIYNFCQMMSNQVFSAQYLRTSLILPKLFDQAKLEYILHAPDQNRIFRSGSSILEQIESATDQIMKELKEYNRAVDKKILCLNLVTLSIVSLLCFFYAVPSLYEYYNIGYPVVLFFIFSMLLYAVIGIRKTIKQVAHAFPRERLICIHFINFVLWIILITAETVLGTISDF